MQYTDERFHLHVEMATKDCDIPADERTRMQQSLDPLGRAVQDLPRSDLWLKIICHDGNDGAPYHVEAKLKLPGQTLFSSDWDAYLDTAFQRCMNKLVHRVQAYREDPGRRAAQQQAAARTGRRAALGNNIVAAGEPEDPDTGPLGRAVTAGDYKAFRTALAGYEDWLRLRVGRWLQRYPEAEKQVGKDVLIGDLVEEIYLNAFERFPRKQEEIPLRDWLDNLVDPSVRAVLQHTDREHENASFARTLRETRL